MREYCCCWMEVVNEGLSEVVASVVCKVNEFKFD